MRETESLCQEKEEEDLSSIDDYVEVMVQEIEESTPSPEKKTHYSCQQQQYQQK